MKDPLHSVLASWREAGKKAGFFILLVAGSAAAGVAIAWPLWFFATSARSVYTGVTLILVCAVAVFVIIRSAIRKASLRSARRRHRLLSVLVGLVQVIVFAAGLLVTAVLFFHKVWVFAVPLLVAWIGLLVLLGIARRAARREQAA